MVFLSGVRCGPQLWLPMFLTTALGLTGLKHSVAEAAIDPSRPVTKTQSNQHHHRVLLAEAANQEGAVCLDGSPGAYYFREGFDSGVHKYYIHHQGGGWCESLDDCLERSTGDLGSSKNYPKSITLDDGYFSNDPAINPMMHNWNNIYMKYCDGASFSGNNETITKYRGVKLFSRGSRIRKAIFDNLSTILANATDVVVSGCSAGGLATFLHTDQWCDDIHMLNPETKCVGMPDSGFFLDYQKSTQKLPTSLSSSRPTPTNIRTYQEQQRKQTLKTIPGNYHHGIQWVYHFSNASFGINEDCVAAASQSMEMDDWKCMFAEHVSPYVHTPMFVLQSEYDSWQTSNVLKPSRISALISDDDVDHDHAINILGKNITARLESNLFHVHPKSGGFVDSCHHHCGAWGQIVIDGDTVAQAFSKWYSGLDDHHTDTNKKSNGTRNKKVWSQNQTYPCEVCCHPASLS